MQDVDLRLASSSIGRLSELQRTQPPATFDGETGSHFPPMVEPMRQVAEFVAVFSCGLFAGAAVYIGLVEHPARMECGVEVAAAEFPPSYRRATIMQATLAAVGLISSIAAWLAGATFWWVVAGVLLGSVIPFTLIVIFPTNRKLTSPALNRQSAQTGLLLARWGRLHAVRSVLSALSFSMFLYLLILTKSM